MVHAKEQQNANQRAESLPELALWLCKPFIPPSFATCNGKATLQPTVYFRTRGLSALKALQTLPTS